MTDKLNNPPAYPSLGEWVDGEYSSGGFPGMTIGDVFAGQLMGPCYMAIARGHTDGESAQEAFVAAKAAYRLADALLMAREERKA